MKLSSEKQRRMEVRRRLGIRGAADWPTAGSPQPVPSYLVAHACFSCRRSFKIRPRDSRQAVCPRCGGPMFEMGRSFKAPASQNREQWSKVQALFAAGFRFFSYRSYACPPLPARLKDVAPFIEANPNHPFRVAPPNPSLQPTASGRG